MEEYRVLFSLQIDHAYFSRKKGFLAMRASQESLSLMRRRQLILKQTNSNRWSLLGKMGVEGVEEDKLRFEFVLEDPTFLYYTEWPNYGQSVYYELILSGKTGTLNIPEVLIPYPEKKRTRISGVLFSAELEVNPQLYESARQNKEREVHLSFAAKEMVWEYLCVPRREHVENQDLVLEEQNGKLLFDPKGFVDIDFLGKSAYRFISRSVIPMRDEYTYQLALSEIIQKSSKVKRLLVRNVEFPDSGNFQDLKGNILRKILYF